MLCDLAIGWRNPVAPPCRRDEEHDMISGKRIEMRVDAKQARILQQHDTCFLFELPGYR